MDKLLSNLNFERLACGFNAWTLEEARTYYQEKLNDTDPEYLPDDYSFEQYLSDQLYAAGLWVGPEYDE